MKCLFTSMWDDGSVIVTPATYDKKTGEVDAVTVDHDTDGCLEREFITIHAETDNEEEIEVCTACHTHVMKAVMNPGMGHDLNEEEECSDPDCDSHN